MARQRELDAFSAHRLGGESLPEDLSYLLTHAEELARRTGIELNGEEGWAPWSDTSYLTAVDRENPDIMASVRAIAEVCEFIVFVAADEDGEYFGYWRGPTRRTVSASPLVLLDNEGRFQFCAGTTLAGAIHGRTCGEEDRAELRDWFVSIGIAMPIVATEVTAFHEVGMSPDALCHGLYERYRGEAGLH